MGTTIDQDDRTRQTAHCVLEFNDQNCIRNSNSRSVERLSMYNDTGKAADAFAKPQYSCRGPQSTRCGNCQSKQITRYSYSSVVMASCRTTLSLLCNTLHVAL